MSFVHENAAYCTWKLHNWEKWQAKVIFAELALWIMIFINRKKQIFHFLVDIKICVFILVHIYIHIDLCTIFLCLFRHIIILL